MTRFHSGAIRAGLGARMKQNALRENPIWARPPDGVVSIRALYGQAGDSHAALLRTRCAKREKSRNGNSQPPDLQSAAARRDREAVATDDAFVEFVGVRRCEGPC
jgi:hypothetical protein